MCLSALLYGSTHNCVFIIDGASGSCGSSVAASNRWPGVTDTLLGLHSLQTETPTLPCLHIDSSYTIQSGEALILRCNVLKAIRYVWKPGV